MRFLILFSLLFSCAASRTQAPTEVADFFLDPVGKDYRLLADDRLATDNPLGQNQFEIFDSSLRGPDVVDVTNPFAILLFYADYGTVVVLDRTLSEVSRLDLFSLGQLSQPVTAARATDQGIWVFDSWDYRLKLMDAAGRPRLESNDLRLEIQIAEAPAAIYVDQDRVLLHFREEHRVAIFTNYGRFERWVLLPPSTEVGWYAPYLTGYSAERYWVWDRRTKEAQTQAPSKLLGKVLTTREGVYHLDEGGDVIFTAKVSTKQ